MDQQQDNPVPAISTDAAARPAGLMRRLGALLYDTLLLAALLMITTAAFLPITGGEAITSTHNPVLEWLYRGTLAGVVCLFYGTSWTRRGQTLGMASWRLRVECEDGSLLGWGDTLSRLAAAALSSVAMGLGWLWILFDPGKRAWHDRLSHTRVVVLPRKRRGA